MRTGMDNGDYLARRSASENQRQAQLQYYQSLINQQQRAAADYRARNPYLTTWNEPPMAGSPGEREAEDVTGLRLLDEFLERRKRNQGE